MMTVKEASSRIQNGKQLFVSGEEGLLAQLPRGAWVGGTIPYFMTEEGGMCSHDKVQVSVLPEFVSDATVRFYGPAELTKIPSDYKPNGFSYVIIPAQTDAHQTFAKDCSTWPGIFNRPLFGWISGVHLDHVGMVKPKVVNGKTGKFSDSEAVVMHLDLPASKFARLNTINLFRKGQGDAITFSTSGFDVGSCFINGQEQNFARYLTSKGTDTHLPLVADYRGAMVNVSFQRVDAASGKVTLYAPVFRGVEYKIAAEVGDYEGEFSRQIAQQHVDAVFSCNCILNYLYAKLEGKKTGDIVGPVTFGEIAYMLLNQTLVYLSFENK